jgi:DNA-binding transcriptional LysR family regulator
MTFEQLIVFIAVAEREHLTQGAAAAGLTPSAASTSIKALEGRHKVRLFSRVGRGLELTSEGKVFLKEARETVARMRAAELALTELSGLGRGRIHVQASQTIANYWLPQRLLQFNKLYPCIEVDLTLGNTTTVVEALLTGAAELGFIEGTIDEPALASRAVASDRLVVVVPSAHRFARLRRRLSGDDLLALQWILRESGSGTRSVFETALRARSINPQRFEVAFLLPSNEAVLTAVRTGHYATALSESVVAPFVTNGELARLDFPLPPRQFTALHHRERHFSGAARQFERLCRNSSTERERAVR